MTENEKRFRIEFTVDAEGFSDDFIKQSAIQELTCMVPYPEDITFSEASSWHTGTPNKDDWYFVLWRDTDDDWRRFSALLWNNHNKVWYDDVTPDTNWGDEYHAEVIAWMPIPDFKEKKDGRTD